MMMQVPDFRVEFPEADVPQAMWSGVDQHRYPDLSAEAQNVYITALPSNQGTIWLGWSKVSSASGAETGRPLQPGEQAFYAHVCLKELYGAADTATVTASGALAVSYEQPRNAARPT